MGLLTPPPLASEYDSSLVFATAGDATAHHAKRAVLVAMCFNIGIAVLKLVVATQVTHSSALLAEGLHSAADAFNSFTLLFGILQGQRPPDRSHPYGYGLETNLWALIASFVLLGSAVFSIWEGWQRLSHPTEPLQNLGWAVGLLILNVFFELGALRAASQAVLQEANLKVEGLPRQLMAAFRHIRKVKSPTTRFVFFEDLVALLGAGIALVALLSTGLLVNYGLLSPHYSQWPDAIASMVIGVMLLLLSFNLFRYNRNFLTVAAASAPVEQSIRQLVLGTHGVSAVLDLKTIDQGLSGLFIQMKIEVNPDIPVREVDDLVEHLKDRLKSSLPQVRDIVVEVLADESEQDWEEVFANLIRQGEQDEILKPAESNLFRKMLDFIELDLSDVMVPRTEVSMVEVNTPLADVAQMFIDENHSKLPVYEEHIDNVLGFLHERDVFHALHHANTQSTPLTELLQDLPIFPENKPLSDLLEEFRRPKVSMVAVIDEHGGFAGLVTLSDILSELVGQLWEDTDVELEADWTQLSPTEWLLDGRAFIEDLNDALELNIPDEDFKTIAGFVFGQLGREPESGDTVRFEHISFHIEALEGHRISKVRLLSDWPLADSTASPPSAE